MVYLIKKKYMQNINQQTQVLYSEWGQSILNRRSSESNPRVLHLIVGPRVDSNTPVNSIEDITSTHTVSDAIMQNTNISTEVVNYGVPDNIHNLSVTMVTNVGPINTFRNFFTSIRNNHMDQSILDTTPISLMDQRIMGIHDQFLSQIRDPFLQRFSSTSNLSADVDAISPMLERINTTGNILRNIRVQHNNFNVRDLFSGQLADYVNQFFSSNIFSPFINFPYMTYADLLRAGVPKNIINILSDFFYSMGYEIFKKLDVLFNISPNIITLLIIAYFFRIFLIICPKSLWFFTWGQLRDLFFTIFKGVKVRFNRGLSGILSNFYSDNTRSLIMSIRTASNQSLNNFSQRLSGLVQRLPVSYLQRFFYPVLGTFSFAGIIYFLRYNSYGREILIYFARSFHSGFTNSIQGVMSSSENRPTVHRQDNLNVKSFVKEITSLLKRYYKDFFN
jgi:hypothetical protein